MNFSKAKRIYLDTNIYICLFNETPRFITKVKEVIKEIQKNKIEVLASALVWHELLSYSTISNTEIALFKSFFSGYKKFKFKNVDTAIAEYAAKIRREYKTIRAPDAIHLATALITDCDLFISADRKLAIKEGKLQDMKLLVIENGTRMKKGILA